MSDGKWVLFVAGFFLRLATPMLWISLPSALVLALVLYFVR